MASIIATIVFIYFLDPILHQLGRLVLGASGFVANGYQDRLFSELATGTVDYGYVILLLVFTLPLGTITGFSFADWALRLSRSGSAQPAKPSPFRYVVPVLLMLFASFFILLDGYLHLRISTSFQQHVRILAPFITDQQQKELWHDWATMHGRRGYEELQAKLDSLAVSHRVTLPDNKLYPLP